MVLLTGSYVPSQVVEWKILSSPEIWMGFPHNFNTPLAQSTSVTDYPPLVEVGQVLMFHLGFLALILLLDIYLVILYLLALFHHWLGHQHSN